MSTTGDLQVGGEDRFMPQRDFESVRDHPHNDECAKDSHSGPETVYACDEQDKDPSVDEHVQQKPIVGTDDGGIPRVKKSEKDSTGFEGEVVTPHSPPYVAKIHMPTTINGYRIACAR